MHIPSNSTSFLLFFYPVVSFYLPLSTHPLLPCFPPSHSWSFNPLRSLPLHPQCTSLATLPLPSFPTQLFTLTFPSTHNPYYLASLPCTIPVLSTLAVLSHLTLNAHHLQLFFFSLTVLPNCLLLPSLRYRALTTLCLSFPQLPHLLHLPLLSLPSLKTCTPQISAPRPRHQHPDACLGRLDTRSLPATSSLHTHAHGNFFAVQEEEEKAEGGAGGGGRGRGKEKGGDAGVGEGGMQR